jgi:hypothetical protein
VSLSPQRVPPLTATPTGDATKLVPPPQAQPDQTDEAVMRTLRELREQIDALARQYPKTGKNAQVSKQAIMAMMRDVLQNPTQPAEAPAPRFG